MYNPVVQDIAHHVERQDISAQVHHWDVTGQSGSCQNSTLYTNWNPATSTQQKVYPASHSISRNEPDVIVNSGSPPQKKKLILLNFVG